MACPPPSVAAADREANGGGVDDRESERSGEFHATKECSGFNKQPGSFCTITSSTLKTIKVGSKVVYLQPMSLFASSRSDVVLHLPHGNSVAYGHCALNFANGLGVCTFSGGTGKFKGFHANVAVTHIGGLNWAWNGTYSFSRGDD